MAEPQPTSIPDPEKLIYIPEISIEDREQREMLLAEVFQEIHDELNELNSTAINKKWPATKYTAELQKIYLTFTDIYCPCSTDANGNTVQQHKAVAQSIKGLIELPSLLMHDYMFEEFNKRRPRLKQSNVPPEQQQHLDKMVEWQQAIADFYLGHRGLISVADLKGSSHNLFHEIRDKLTPLAHQGLNDIYKITKDLTNTEQLLQSKWQGAVGAAALASFFQNATIGRYYYWTPPRLDIANKIDLIGKHENKPTWCLQIKTRLKEESQIIHAHEYRKKFTVRAQKKEIEAFIDGVHDYDNAAIPIVAIIQYRSEDFNRKTGMVSLSIAKKLKQQLEKAKNYR